MKIFMKKLREDAVIPSYATKGSAGMDISFCGGPVTLQPGERKLLHTGLSLAIPEGYEAQIRPRSGLALKDGIILPNSPGTIDSDYRGELKIIVANIGDKPVTLSPGQRVAQMVISKVERAEPVWSDELPGSERGNGGFGSTGK